MGVGGCCGGDVLSVSVRMNEYGTIESSGYYVGLLI